MKCIINLEKISDSLIGDLVVDMETFIEVKHSINKLYINGLIEDDNFVNTVSELQRILRKIKEGL